MIYSIASCYLLRFVLIIRKKQNVLIANYLIFSALRFTVTIILFIVFRNLSQNL